MLTIDAHHHLWRYNPQDFDWLDEPLRALRRDFLLDDLRREMAAAHIDATIAVQARQSLAETHWLLAIAAATPLIQGVVGWAPLADPTFPATLDSLRAHPRLRGLRHVVQGEPDDDFILGLAFNRGIAALAGTGLVYEVLIFPRHLPPATAFVDRHPTQPFVLDHAAKPAIGTGIGTGLALSSTDPWAANIRELARRPHVACKLSGLVTEADWATWSLDTLRPYLDVLVEAFGPARLLAGSDWPVCLVASPYSCWFETLHTYFATFSAADRAAIFGGNATRIYNLTPLQS